MADAVWREPMLAELAKAREWIARRGPGWVYERKLDGLRCVAVRTGGEVRLWSRNHNSFSARFPHVVEALARQPVSDVTLDGELVAFDGNDYVGFGALQQPGSTLEVVYCVFDLLHLLGRDTTGLALLDRKKLLAQAVEPSQVVRVVDELGGDPAELLDKACSSGWEGLIAKRSESTYVAGRSSDWRKLKCSASQELVIGGWTEPRGSRVGLGALLVGYYEGAGLRYAGKVGTGFSTAMLRQLHAQLVALEIEASPFVDPVPERGAHWAKPKLVGNVGFTEWTGDGRLRHPRFEGLRDDKDPRKVVRERPLG
ncbi:MAG: non-homologous end-joining DNA ligase [Acidimicrobiales bacterium]|nr:non-homologous end-joining DNA ligase [Acidimicrobiales bacterium]